MRTLLSMKSLAAVPACLFVMLQPADVKAWDTGPAACKHDECSGGKTNGIMGSDADKMLMWSGNTHLWVVNRALDLLAKSADLHAKNVVARMNKKSCRERWESGLWEVDHGYLAEDLGVGQSPETKQRLGSHFYNGAGHDGFGNPTTVTTYTMLGTEKLEFGNARLNARYRLPGMLRRPGDNLPDTNGTINGVDVRPPKGADAKKVSDREFLEMTFKPYYAGNFSQDTEAGDDRCYDLGLALHYLTDITQPMHASSFDAFKIPTMLHAVFEEYVPTIQANFPVGDQRWQDEQAMVTTPKSADEVFDEVARASNAMAPALLKVLMESPDPCSYVPEAVVNYTRAQGMGGCFRYPSRKDVVEAATGKVLRQTYQWVASYLWATFREEYQVTEVGRRCPIGASWANDNKCYGACPPGYKPPTGEETTFCIEVCPNDLCTDKDGIPRGMMRIARLSVPARDVAAR
jgi:hypothetical protein